MPGANGIFDVVADGTTLFTKKGAVRFPKEEEIVAALRKLGQGAG